MKRSILATVALLLTGCLGGTETGNPGGMRGASDPIPPALGVLAEICYRLSSCHRELSWGDCAIGVYYSTSIDTELGLPGPYVNYGEILTLEKAGAIKADGDAVNACILETRSLDCSDSRVVDAWSAATPNDFSRIERILPQDPGSCPDAFSTTRPRSP